MLKILCKFLGAHYFFTFRWIYFILGMVIDTGLKFLAASARSHDHNLGVKVTDFEYLC